MTVFTRYGDAVKDPSSIRPADSISAEASMRQAYSKISVASDSSTSIYLLARLPSNCRLDPNGSIKTTALTGMTSLSVGLGVNGAVVNSKTGALINAADVHLAGSVAIMKDVAAGSLGKKLWDLAGYSADPGGMIDIIGTTGADCSTTGSIEAFIPYMKG